MNKKDPEIYLHTRTNVTQNPKWNFPAHTSPKKTPVLVALVFSHQGFLPAEDDVGGRDAQKETSCNQNDG